MYKTKLNTLEGINLVEEIFLSFQGEGESIGKPLVFLRLTEDWSSIPEEFDMKHIQYACEHIWRFKRDNKINDNVGICITTIDDEKKIFFLYKLLNCLEGQYIETEWKADIFFHNFAGRMLFDFFNGIHNLYFNIKLSPSENYTKHIVSLLGYDMRKFRFKLPVTGLEELGLAVRNNKDNDFVKHAVIYPKAKSKHISNGILRNISEYCMKNNLTVSPILNYLINED